MRDTALDPRGFARLSGRRAEIVAAVGAAGSVAVAELAARLGVSEETIRRDVRLLAADGFVRKRHGAVLRPDPTMEPPLNRRMRENADAKARIASRVATLVDDGDTVLLDTGSTTIFVAHALAGRRGLKVVTNSAEAARILAADGHAGIYLAGGEMRGDDGAVFGPQAVAFVSGFFAKTAILSAGAVDAEAGLMVFDPREAAFSQAMIAQAERVIVAADRSKFGRRAFARVCGVDRIDTLVTDAAPPADLAARLAEAGARVLVAG